MMMTERLIEYAKLLDALREQRRSPGWRAAMDRELLAQVEDLYDQLTPDERRGAESLGWRAWPDEYDARERQP